MSFVFDSLAIAHNMRWDNVHCTHNQTERWPRLCACDRKSPRFYVFSSPGALSRRAKRAKPGGMHQQESWSEENRTQSRVRCGMAEKIVDKRMKHITDALFRYSFVILLSRQMSKWAGVASVPLSSPQFLCAQFKCGTPATHVKPDSQTVQVAQAIWRPILSFLVIYIQVTLGCLQCIFKLGVRWKIL